MHKILTEHNLVDLLKFISNSQNLFLLTLIIDGQSFALNVNHLLLKLAVCKRQISGLTENSPTHTIFYGITIA